MIRPIHWWCDKSRKQPLLSSCGASGPRTAYDKKSLWEAPHARSGSQELLITFAKPIRGVGTEPHDEVARLFITPWHEPIASVTPKSEDIV